MKITSNCTPEVIQKAAAALMDGNLVAFPTETVYGLGADAGNEKAISRLYKVKRRPTTHPLIVHISSITHLSKWAVEVPEYALKLGEKFWPGPMTLIVKRSGLAMDFITGAQGNVGIRVPNQQVALSLIKEFEQLGGDGVAAPSANKFGAVSPTDADAVNEEIGADLNSNDFILNDGDCSIGVESTIIDCTNAVPMVIRPGWLTSEQIIECTGLILREKNLINSLKAPGLLNSHYSPKARVFLDSMAGPGEGFIALAEVSTPEGSVRLASPATIEEFAAEIYSALRDGDKKELDKIFVIQPSGGGLALAIRDRLGKAAEN
jgi:L-threonylcarbamoyladenylate synthase